MGLCTLALAKSYGKITSSSHDTLLTNLIKRASGQIDSWTNRTLARADYVELYNGDGDRKLYLDHYPIVSVSKLSIDIDKETQTINEEIAAANTEASTGIIGDVVVELREPEVEPDLSVTLTDPGGRRNRTQQQHGHDQN